MSQCRMSQCRLLDWRMSQCRMSQCRFLECRISECHGQNVENKNACSKISLCHNLRQNVVNKNIARLNKCIFFSDRLSVSCLR